MKLLFVTLTKQQTRCVTTANRRVDIFTTAVSSTTLWSWIRTHPCPYPRPFPGLRSLYQTVIRAAAGPLSPLTPTAVH